MRCDAMRCDVMRCDAMQCASVRFSVLSEIILLFYFFILILVKALGSVGHINFILGKIIQFCCFHELLSYLYQQSFIENFSTNYILSNPRAKLAAEQRPRARGGLFTDLSIYPYGGTSADLSKIPPILRGIIVYFFR